MPKIIHYRQRCIGCNACVEIDYERWRMSKKDGKAVLLHGINKKGVYQLEVPYDAIEVCEKVIEACPVKVIQLVGV